MAVPESTYTIILIVAIVILSTLYIVGLIKSLRAGSTNRRAAIPALTLSFLLCVYLLLRGRDIGPADWAQIVLLFGLVVVTGVYALSATRQADASMKMAEEMIEQRRPIIVQNVVPAKGIPYKLATEDVNRSISSDSFEIRNVGNGPAIELEILLLNYGKSLLQHQRKTFFSQAGDAPIEFHPQGLESYVNSTCYLLCQYRGVLSRDVKQIWYQTRLPFEPAKSQRGDRIIITPRELEFGKVYKKESY